MANDLGNCSVFFRRAFDVCDFLEKRAFFSSVMDCQGGFQRRYAPSVLACQVVPVGTFVFGMVYLADLVSAIIHIFRKGGKQINWML